MPISDWRLLTREPMSGSAVDSVRDPRVASHETRSAGRDSRSAKKEEGRQKLPK